MLQVLEQVRQEYMQMPVAELIETAHLMGVEMPECLSRKRLVDELLSLEQYAAFH